MLLDLFLGYAGMAMAAKTLRVYPLTRPLAKSLDHGEGIPGRTGRVTRVAVRRTVSRETTASRISPSHPIPGYQHDQHRPPPTKSPASRPSAVPPGTFPSLTSAPPLRKGSKQGIPRTRTQQQGAHPGPQTHKAYRASRATQRELDTPETGVVEFGPE